MITKATETYLKTALWSSTDNDSDPMDDNYGIEDCSEELIKKAEDDVSKFYELAHHLVTDDDDDHFEHDFWLTRNRHGAGFWDGDYENGDELTEIAQSFGECWLYIGDDGWIYGG